MNDVFKSVIFGVIEGITEWLPVSSTGHLIIAESFISFSGVSEGFYAAYSVIIQLGAVLSVALIFFRRMFPFENRGEKTALSRDILSFDFKIAVGCIPAAVAGFFLNDIIEEKFYSVRTVSAGLIIYGILFIIIEKMKKKSEPSVLRAEDIDFKRVLGIGIFQMLSLIPGTSRSGSTVIGGLLCSLSRYSAAEFSFFMAIPVMAGASVYKAAAMGFNFSFYEFVILYVGFITSFTISVFTVKRLMSFVKKNTFTPFGVYRILLGIILLIFDF